MAKIIKEFGKQDCLVKVSKDTRSKLKLKAIKQGLTLKAFLQKVAYEK